jgi:ABC-type transport system substrate-binding protein
MRSMRGRLRAVLVAAALGAVGCGREVPAPIATAHPDQKEPQRGGTLHLATFADIRSVDPANLTDGLAPQVIEQMFAGLVEYDLDGKIRPDIAERWEVADEGRTYRFFLRPNVRFHDGDEVTADDVKRSIERALHPSAPNPYSSYFASLEGYADFTAKKSESLAGVTVEGRYVVSLHMKEPDATMLPLFALQVLRPVCKSGGTRYSDAWHPCGAGPFKLPPDGWQHGHSLSLVRHEGYFRPGLPHLDGIQWTLHENQSSQMFKFVRGDLDVLLDFNSPDLLRFQADPRWAPFAEFDGGKQILGEAMNVEMPPFDNVEIRRAVAAAIDRDTLSKVRAANLRATNQLVPPGISGYEPNIAGQKFDLSAALEHMRRAGYPYDPATKTGGWPHPVPYVVYKQGLQEAMCQVLAQQLEQIGIHLELRIVNYPTFMALRGRRGGMAIGPGFWTQDFPDALSFLEPLFHSRSISPEDSNNWSFYSNPRFDELVDRAHKELDEPRRLKLYSEAQGILVDDAPWAFTETYRWYVQRQPYVREHHVHPMWMHDVSRTWLDRGAGPALAHAMFDARGVRAIFGGSSR